VSDAQIKNTQNRSSRGQRANRGDHTQAGGERQRFLCECGRDDCLEILALSLVDYEAMRNGEFFIAAPGHCVEGVNRLVGSRDGFDVLAQA
jgi:hypothetical protein